MMRKWEGVTALLAVAFQLITVEEARAIGKSPFGKNASYLGTAFTGKTH